MTEINDTVLNPSKSVLTSGLVSGGSLRIVPQASYSVDLATAFRDIFNDKITIRPTPNDDCSHTAITWEALSSTVRKIQSVLLGANYGCSNEISIAADLLDEKLATASPDGDVMISFSRQDTKILSQAYVLLTNNTNEAMTNAVASSSIIKEVSADLQSLPDNTTMEQNLDIIDNTAALNTTLGFEIGQDSGFITENSGLIDQLIEVVIDDAIPSSITTAPSTLGVIGTNVAPLIFGDNTPIVESNTRNIAAQQADEAYWTSITDEVSEFVSPMTLQTPIKDQEDIVAEIYRTNYTTQDIIGTVQITLSGSTTPTSILTTIPSLTEVSNDEVMDEIGSSNLLELDYAMALETVADIATVRAAAADNATVLSLMAKYQNTGVSWRMPDTAVLKYTDIISRNSAEMRAMTDQDWSKVRLRSLVKTSRIIPGPKAISWANTISKVWNAVKKVKISDIDQVLNVVKIGCCIGGKLTGSQGLSNASQIMDTLQNGLSTLQSKTQAIATAAGDTNQTTITKAFQTQVAGTLLNAVPTAFELGKNFLRSSTRTSSNQVLSKTNEIARNSRELKGLVLSNVQNTQSVTMKNIKAKLKLKA